MTPSSDPTAIEIAARALYNENFITLFDEDEHDEPWETLTEGERDAYRNVTRGQLMALSAADIYVGRLRAAGWTRIFDVETQYHPGGPDESGCSRHAIKPSGGLWEQVFRILGGDHGD